MPSNEWAESLKFIVVPLGVTFVTFLVRRIAVYLKDSRVKEHADWLESKEGKLYMDGMMDDWQSRRKADHHLGR